MAKILGVKSGQLTIQDALMIAGAKIVSERLLANAIGNGSIMSGGIKLAGAYGVKSFVGGKVSDIVATAMTIDGAEDIVSAFFPTISSGILGNKTQEVELV